MTMWAQRPAHVLSDTTLTVESPHSSAFTHGLAQGYASPEAASPLASSSLPPALLTPLQVPSVNPLHPPLLRP